MYLKLNNQRLYLGQLIETVQKDKSERTTFPYTSEVCRCRYCLYCHNGKCSLKRCLWMRERVKSKSCTFTELLKDCFVNIKDNVFQYRLRLAYERASELRSCFVDTKHKSRFLEGKSLVKNKDYELIAQVFLLSATESLWIKAKQTICTTGFIDYGCFGTNETNMNDYLLLCTAMDIHYGSSYIDLYKLTIDGIVDFDIFRIICYSVAICIYGMDAVKSAQRKKTYNLRQREGNKR